MKKILIIIFIFSSLFASSQELMNKNFEGFRVKVSELVIDNDTLNISGTGGIEVNAIDADTMKIDGVPLLLNTFKQGNLGGAGNIFYSTGASSQPASGIVNQVIGGNALTANYVPKWDGSKFANSNISSSYGDVIIGINSGGVDQSLYIYSDTPDKYIKFTSGGNYSAFINYGNQDMIFENAGVGAIDFYTNNMLAGNISANQNWGIGKSATSEKMDINGNLIGDTIKARADIIVTGEIYDEINHLYGMVYDSTITLSLTQNVWQQVTNPTKTLYSTAEQDGITISGDTIVFSKAGGYDVYFEFNCTGIDSKDYHYRILQKNGTTTVRSYNKYASTGTQVIRNEKAYVHVAAGSKVWCEIMSPSSAPGNVTIQGAKIYAMQRYLEK